MRKRFVAFLILGVVLLFCGVFGQNSDECDECKKDPSKCCDKYPDLCNPPGCDNPDESYSVSTIVPGASSTASGSVNILERGYWRLADNLFSNFCDSISFVEISGDLKLDFVVIPTGAFSGKSNDTTIQICFRTVCARRGEHNVFCAASKGRLFASSGPGRGFPFRKWMEV